MGKGSGGCDDRTALCVETQPAFPSIASILTIQPRRERTTWATADKRFKFMRFRTGWTVSARSIYDDTATPDEREMALVDRSLLREAGILDEQHNPVMVFGSLVETRKTLMAVTRELEQPPENTLLQGDIAYLVDPITFRIAKTPQGWTIKCRGTTTRTITKQVRIRYTGRIAQQIDYHAAIMSIIDEEYPTRASALAAIATMLDDIETMAQALQTVDTVAA